MSRHGGSLGHVATGGVETSLISVILNIDLLSLWSDETVAAADSIWCTNLLSGGSIIVGEAAKMRLFIIKDLQQHNTHLKL